jgi:hypothetical protein
VSDEHKLLRDADRAARARQLLENELLTEAFKSLEDAYMTHWRQTNIDDVNGREKLFLAINVIGIVRDHLAVVVSNGKMADAELRLLAAKRELEKQRKRRFGIL